MRIVLVNVPHPSIGSRVPREQLTPLGLLCIGGPLIDDGHDVSLIDGEFGPMPIDTLIAQVAARTPEIVMFGHSGSSSAQPIISAVAADVKAKLPDCIIVYGGVHPTYHWRDLLRDDASVDVIVRGEGEETVVALAAALRDGQSFHDIPGLAFRRSGKACCHTEGARHS